jgi:hypothetical protein
VKTKKEKPMKKIKNTAERASTTASGPMLLFARRGVLGGDAGNGGKPDELATGCCNPPLSIVIMVNPQMSIV